MLFHPALGTAFVPAFGRGDTGASDSLRRMDPARRRRETFV